jgi:hypothetical protein
MPAPYRMLAVLEGVLALVALGGLVYRARHLYSRAFIAYGCTVVGRGIAAAAWPDASYNWSAWSTWQVVQVALKLAILFEISTHVFGPFPGALAAVRGIITLVLWATAAALVTVQVAGKDLWDFALQAAPIANQGAAWGFTLVLVLSVWFFVPMDSWRRALVIGMAAYGMAFTGAMAALERFGWGARESLGYLNMGAYVLLLAYWNVAAWRKATAEDAEVERLRQELPLRLAARGHRP